MIPIIQAAAAKIGITFKVRSVNGAYPVDPDAVEEHPDLGAARLGQGLRRRVDVLQRAVRRAARSSRPGTPTTRSSASRRRSRRRWTQAGRSPASRAWTRTSTLQPGRLGQARLDLLGRTLDKKLMTQVVPWVPVPLGEQPQHHQPERHEVELRPVLGPDRRTRTWRSSSDRRAAGAGRLGAPAPHFTRTRMPLYIARRLVWTVVVVLVVLLITFAVFYLLPAATRRSASPASRRRRRCSPRSGTGSGSTRRGTSSSRLFVKHFVVGDQYGWPGLGYSYDGSVSVLSEVTARAPQDPLADLRRGDPLARHRRRDRRRSRRSGAARSSTAWRWASRSSASRRRSSGSA